MRRFFAHIVLIFVASCSQPMYKEDLKRVPSFSSNITDPEIRTIVDEFFKLSARYNIRFTNNVTIGLSKINKGKAIGLCTYRSNFREIDLDSDYWEYASWEAKLAVTFHELTHCYCGRDHDFGDGRVYPDDSWLSNIQEFIKKKLFPNSKLLGYFDDYCPESIMHPTIVNNSCFINHYSHYVEEMFLRCDPY